MALFHRHEFKKPSVDFALARTRALHPGTPMVCRLPVIENFPLRLRWGDLLGTEQAPPLHVHAVLLFSLPATSTAGSCPATSRRATRTVPETASSLIKVKCLRAKCASLVTPVMGGGR
jgi:hypothetical protein